MSSALPDDLLYFPDMRWLGGHHDGYCRSTSLSAYSWIRFSTVKTRRDNLALWQSTLSFGVLEAITGMRIPESLLLSPQLDGSVALTSKNVSRFISSWLFGCPDASSHTATPGQMASSAYKIISAALRAISEAVMQKETGILAGTGSGLDEMDDMICALTTLSSSFISVLMLVVRMHSAPSTESLDIIGEEGPGFAFAIWHQTKTIGKRLEENGWCPFTVEALKTTTMLPTSPFLTPYSPGHHVACNRISCVAHNLNSAEYKTQHAPGCSDPSCPFIAPSIAHVSGLLSIGQIPVIIYDGCQLAVRNAVDGPYIAISHVWADGLGSVTEAGLPTCQISRIVGFARQLVPDGAFWVDALCVPDVKELRKRAILLMAKTYRKADQVIVFDSGLRTLCRSSSPFKEIVFRIVTSSWMQRVWTLQEAMLARGLHFEFADGLFPITQLEEAYQHIMSLVPSSLGKVPRDPFVVEFMPQNLSLMFNRKKGSASKRLRTTRTYTLQDVVSLLRYRTTSKPEDETIAIAGLLRTDTTRLLAESDADARMRRLLA
ncbi:hypothetical protein C8Q74DRAFT_478489 [Fomes fomentarius]|nr:hypothetical protein C8Q74DRAFT_478489 [Fomes fomentarius]